MRSLLVVLTLVVALVACGKPEPKYPVPRGPVTAAALEQYFKGRFPAQYADGSLVMGFGSAGTDGQVITELHVLGIDDMKGVAALVPADFQTKGFDAIKSSADPTSNIAALMRDLMIIHDTHGYFEKAWNHTWSANGPEDFAAPAAYGVDFKMMAAMGAFGGGDPCGGDPCAGDPCDGGGDPCSE